MSSFSVATNSVSMFVAFAIDGRVAIAGAVVGVLATVVVVVTVVGVTVLYAVVAADMGVKMDCRVTGRTGPCGLCGGSCD